MEEREGLENKDTAVALKYEAGVDSAPVVVAKGKGYIAEQIVKTAKHYRIPVLFNVKLAQLLYQVSLDKAIPASLYELVAEVLAWVYSLDTKLGPVSNTEVVNG